MINEDFVVCITLHYIFRSIVFLLLFYYLHSCTLIALSLHSPLNAIISTVSVRQITAVHTIIPTVSVRQITAVHSKS